MPQLECQNLQNRELWHRPAAANHPETFFEQQGMNFRVDTSNLFNSKGEPIGHVEVVQDITATAQSAEYQRAEVARLTHNMELLAQGNLEMDLTVGDGGKYNQHDQENFTKINKSLVDVKKAVTELALDVHVLTDGTIQGKLGTRADIKKHVGVFSQIVEGVNNTLDAVIGPLTVSAKYVDMISKGDIPAKITDTYNGDFNEIKNNLNMCIDAVKALVADAALLSNAAVEGKLATRADASKHQGDYRKIVQGVNETLDAVIGPLTVSAKYVDMISKGDIPAKITDTYKGDFNEIKNNLNMCIDAVNALVAETGALGKASGEGKLATRADASKHQGDYRKLVEGVNEMLDAILLPIGEGNRVLAQISRQDRRTDRANLQGRPREDEAGGQQRRRSAARVAGRGTLTEAP